MTETMTANQNARTLSSSSTGRWRGWRPTPGMPAPTVRRRSPRSPAASAPSASPTRSGSARTAMSSPVMAALVSRRPATRSSRLRVRPHPGEPQPNRGRRSRRCSMGSALAMFDKHERETRSGSGLYGPDPTSSRLFWTTRNRAPATCDSKSRANAAHVPVL